MIRLLAALLGLAGAALGPADAAPQPSFGAPTRFTEQGGAAVYAGVCAGCHQPNGAGAAGAGAYPSLAGNPRLAVAGYPIAVVLHGLHGMPGFGQMLDDDQVAAVVGYVRTHFGNDDATPVSAADVKGAR